MTAHELQMEMETILGLSTTLNARRLRELADAAENCRGMHESALGTRSYRICCFAKRLLDEGTPGPVVSMVISFLQNYRA